MKKILSVALSFIAFSNLANGQTLEKMNWFNEPENWKIGNDFRKTTQHVSF